MTLSKGNGGVHGNIISRTSPGGYAQTNTTQRLRVICVPDTIDPRKERT